VRILLLAACVVFSALHGYRAIAGNRLSKKPSRRSDEEVRLQSALAAVFSAILGLLVLFGG